MNTRPQGRKASCRPLFAFAILFALIAPTLRAAEETTLTDIYGHLAADHGPHRNPVIVIPGILGSQLRERDTQQLVWGANLNKIARANDIDESQLFALPVGPSPLNSLKDNVEAFDALDQIKLGILGLPVIRDAYQNILMSLGTGGYVDENITKGTRRIKGEDLDWGDDHFTCFQFPYDWRRSNVESAAELDRFISEKQKLVREQMLRRYGEAPAKVKFDIVAHSMGGLVARYYLRYGSQSLPKSGLPHLNWAGAQNVDKVILVGTPNAGSIQALMQLLKGFRPLPFLKRYDFHPALLGTMPSIYELLPRARHHVLIDEATGTSLDLLDPDLWEKHQWGLNDPDFHDKTHWLSMNLSEMDHHDLMRDHVRKCLANARAFHAAMDRPAKLPSGLKLYITVGDGIATNAAASLSPRWRIPYPTTKLPGDGTVPRYSALMDERLTQGSTDTGFLKSPIDWTHTFVLPDEHLKLTQSTVFIDNVLHILLDQP